MCSHRWKCPGVDWQSLAAGSVTCVLGTGMAAVACVPGTCMTAVTYGVVLVRELIPVVRLVLIAWAVGSVVAEAGSCIPLTLALDVTGPVLCELVTLPRAPTDHSPDTGALESERLVVSPGLAFLPNSLLSYS